MEEVASATYVDIIEEFTDSVIFTPQMIGLDSLIFYISPRACV